MYKKKKRGGVGEKKKSFDTSVSQCKISYGQMANFIHKETVGNREKKKLGVKCDTAMFQVKVKMQIFFAHL